MKSVPRSLSPRPGRNIADPRATGCRDPGCPDHAYSLTHRAFRHAGWGSQVSLVPRVRADSRPTVSLGARRRRCTVCGARAQYGPCGVETIGANGNGGGPALRYTPRGVNRAVPDGLWHRRVRAGGKIAASPRRHWVSLIAADPGVADVLGTLPDETAVPLKEIGHATDVDAKDLAEAAECFY